MKLTVTIQVFDVLKRISHTLRARKTINSKGNFIGKYKIFLWWIFVETHFFSCKSDLQGWQLYSEPTVSHLFSENMFGFVILIPMLETNNNAMHII